MEVHNLIEELKTYDFKKNSILSFHQKTGISPKTIKKYLTQYNIPHNSKGVKHPGIRDSSGRFCLNYIPNLKKNSPNITSEIPKLKEDEQKSKDLQDPGVVKEMKKVVESSIPRSIRLVDITRKIPKRTPEEQIAYIQKSIQN